MPSKAFGSRRPILPHLLNAGGIPSEVADLRADTEAAFLELEQWITPTVTFAPGSVAAPGIFTDWATLYAATKSFTGPLRIFFDARLAPVVGTCSIPAGAYVFASHYLSFDGSESTNTPVGLATVIDFTQGATLSTLRMIRNVRVQTSSSISPLTFPLSNLSVFEMYGTSQLKCTGSAPLISFPSGATTDELFFFMFDRAFILSPTGAATSVVKLTGPGKFIFEAFGSCNISANAIGAPTAAQVVLEYTDDTSVTAGQAGILDTGILPAALVLFSKCINTAYTPGAPASWNGSPANVSVALDRLAALAKTLNGGTPVP